MMDSVLIANIISFLALFFTFYASSRKEKKKVLFYQTIYMIMMLSTNIILKAHVAIITNLVAITRNIIVIKDINFKNSRYVFASIVVVFGLIFNNRGIVGFLPIIANLCQTLVIANPKSKDIHIHAALSVSYSVWSIHGLLIQNYVSFATDFINALINIKYLITNKNEWKEKMA